MTIMETASIDGGDSVASIQAHFHDDLDDSSTTSTSTGRALPTTTTNSDDDDAQQSTRKLMGASNGTADAVKRSKVLVYVVLMLAAAVVAGLVFTFVNNSEESDFEAKSVYTAKHVIESAEESAKETFSILDSLSNQLTSYALGTNATFPFLTLPTFDIRSTPAYEKATTAELILFAPLVKRSQRAEWETYSVQHQDWIQQDLLLRGLQYAKPGKISTDIYPIEEASSGDEIPLFSAPIWQVAPVPTDASIVNLDLYSHPSFRRMMDDALDVKHILLSEVADVEFLTANVGTLDSDRAEHPRSYAVQPVYDRFATDATIVGFLIAVVAWDSYFLNVLQTEAFEARVVDACGTEFSYLIEGKTATFGGSNHGKNGGTGEKQLSSCSSYEHLQQTAEFASFAKFDGDMDENSHIIHCSYTLSVCPTDDFKSQFESNDPVIFTVFIIVVFLFTTMVFVIYDCTVQRRQDQVMATTKRYNALVSSLFPKNVQQRILEEVKEQSTENQNGTSGYFGITQRRTLAKYVNTEEEGKDSEDFCDSKPIADFFPEATVMFADIVGFTAWSSAREPTQVFTLLESIFREYDLIAKRRGIFKVETVGDCYVAAAGLPQKRHDHAVVMARFSRDCINKMGIVTKRLERTLGPDTGDLAMRIGLHSGPVTAGVLRGEKSRFQLFGDTMNTTARIESNGKPGSIHLSSETAQLLENAGKKHWLIPREDKIVAKGKGEMTTFWLGIKSTSNPSQRGSSAGSEGDSSNLRDLDDLDLDTDVKNPAKYEILDSKTSRLVDWNTDVLARLLRQIVARRNAMAEQNIVELEPVEFTTEGQKQGTVIDEVKEIIQLPEFNATILKNQQDPETITLNPEVMNQLKNLVASLATMYRDNPFHSFEHASHVTMSVVKLQSRIVAPDSILEEVGDTQQEGKVASMIHDHTYGITSDPLTQFSCVFAALIHDVDHCGVPNATLVKEKAPVACAYNNQSVAEQNSIDLAWALLMDPSYEQLRETICATQAEKTRFRALVVNAVLATDIVDKDLKALRNARWDKAFEESPAVLSQSSSRDNVNRKATIVIEHLIQASDIAHTMQHWHVYRKWNERLFHEMYDAYRNGRSEKDPSDFWAKGEIGFFDFYIIPLAKKLKDCGVFGVSSDEYLTYAKSNRDEWKLRGEEVTAGMIEKYKTMYDELDAAAAAGASDLIDRTTNKLTSK